MMSTPRFARGTKSRLFLYIGAVTVAGVVVYLFHGAQMERDSFQKKADKCVQQQESLSAQLQVIIEYKVRLEKSLQQEKADHRHTKEELQIKLDGEKQLREKENEENINKYTSIQQQYKMLQSNHEDLTGECNRLRDSQLQVVETRNKLETALKTAKAELQTMQVNKEKEMENLKSQYLALEIENEKLEKQNKELMSHGQAHNTNMNHLEKENIQLRNQVEKVQDDLRHCEAHSPSIRQIVEPGMGSNKAILSGVVALPKPSSSPVAVAPHELQIQVLKEPLHDGEDKVSQGSQKSTTPQINPDAVLSREKAGIPVPAAPEPGAKPSTSTAKTQVNQGPEPPQDLHGEGALQAPNWDAQKDAEIPNQPAFQDINAGAGFIENWNNQHNHVPGNIPAGVVPAPHGYSLDNDENAVRAPSHEAAARNGIEDRWEWKRFKPWPPQGAAVEDRALGMGHQAARGPLLPLPIADLQRRRQLAEPHQGIRLHDHQQAQGGEEEKEIPRQLHNHYEYNGEYEKDHHGDLQLEEGEEEGEDDDVDQIDYANENGNGVETRQKHINIKEPIVNVNKHDSVMVNPKRR